jgi:quercetin dioxygenase-like cupin family protein
VFHEVWSSPSSPGGDPTEPLDYGIVAEGDVWRVLDGEDMQLQRGDIVVQRGTKHAWSNRTEQMARMAFILLDGRHADELKEVLQ